MMNAVRFNRTTVLALTTSALVFSASVAIGSAAFTVEEPTAGGIFRLEGSSGEVFVQILGRNVSAALLLFSGFVLFGATTVMGLMFIGTWVGAGFQAMSSETGLSNLSPLVLLYLPFEFVGLLAAGAAGLIPLVAFLRRSFARDDAVIDRRPGHGPALKLLGVASLLIVAGALLETFVIHLASA